jgi:hypothetical protein
MSASRTPDARSSRPSEVYTLQEEVDLPAPDNQCAVTH